MFHLKAAFIGCGAARTFVCALAVLAAPAPQRALSSPLFLAACLIFLLAGVLLDTLVLAICVSLTRGKRHVAWRSAGHDESLRSWAVGQWRHYGNDGLQQGFRLLGFEVAIHGALDQRRRARRGRATISTQSWRLRFAPRAKS